MRASVFADSAPPRPTLTHLLVVGMVVACAGCHLVLDPSDYQDDFETIDASSNPVDAAPPGTDAIDAAAVDGRPLTPCPAVVTYETGPYGTSYRVGINMDWVAASDSCKTDGTHLVVIEDDLENEFLRMTIGSGDYSIGLHDMAIEDSFEWVTGVPVNYENWNDFEPNDGGNGEDCVVVNSAGRWNDVSCNKTNAFVCECDT